MLRSIPARTLSPLPSRGVAIASADPTADRAAQLRALFPDVFADGKLDVAKLRSALGDAVAGEGEGYKFSWEGRTDAVEILRTPTRATLLPAPEESINFDTTKNLYIEGDNLEVLKLLYKPYAGRVKLIYIDPPYNTGNDFIYPDDFRDTLANYLKQTKQTDDAGKLLRSNPETSGRYHSDWLSMMYPRLFMAKQLLRDDDGVIFVSIDDHEVHHMRMLMNEVFGEENFRAQISWQKRYTRSNNTIDFTTTVEYILVFSRSEAFTPNLLPRSEEADARYTNPDNDPRGPWKGASFLNPATPLQRPKLCYPITNPKTGIATEPTTNAWRRSKSEFARLASEDLLYWGSDGKQSIPAIKMFLSESRGLTPINFWSHEYAGNTDDGTRDYTDIFDEKGFDNPKPILLIKRILEHGTNADSLVLDFFSGSATTAQAALELNREDGGTRRFILVQLPEQTGNKKYPTIAEIGKERIRRVIAQLNAGTGNLTRTEPEDLGFKVYKLAESNFNLWAGVPERTPAAYQRQLRLIAEEPLRAGWTANGLLWEVAVKEGYGLTSTIEPVAEVSASVYKVADAEKGQHFLACLDEMLPADIAKQLGLTTNDLFVVRDLALDDTLASNLALQCRLKVI